LYVCLFFFLCTPVFLSFVVVASENIRAARRITVLSDYAPLARKSQFPMGQAQRGSCNLKAASF
jgi:hypothetical protein